MLNTNVFIPEISADVYWNSFHNIQIPFEYDICRNVLKTNLVLVGNPLKCVEKWVLNLKKGIRSSNFLVEQ